MTIRLTRAQLKQVEIEPDEAYLMDDPNNPTDRVWQTVGEIESSDGFEPFSNGDHYEIYYKGRDDIEARDCNVTLPTVAICYQFNARRPDYDDKIRAEGLFYAISKNYELVVQLIGKDIHTYILDGDTIDAHIEALIAYRPYLKHMNECKIRWAKEAEEKRKVRGW